MIKKTIILFILTIILGCRSTEKKREHIILKESLYFA